MKSSHICVVAGLSLSIFSGLVGCSASVLDQRHSSANAGNAGLALAANALGADANSFSSSGDPHITAGNGDTYDNQLAGYFTDLISQTLQTAIQAGTAPTQQADSKWWLLLATGQRSCYNAKIYCGQGSARAKLNMSAHLLIGVDAVDYNATSGILFLNQVKQDLSSPVALALGGSVTHGNPGDDGDADEHLTIVSPVGDQILIDRIADGSLGAAQYLNISGTVAPNRANGHVIGAYGDFNGSQTGSELVDRDGTVDTDLTTFLSSWKSTSQEQALVNIK